MVISSSAAPLGYWRFENAGNLGQDASGNGLDLTAINNPVTTNLVGATGAGQNFFTNGIPQTGQSNTLAVRLNGNNCFSGSGYPAFTNMSAGQLTVEAFINAASVPAATTVPIASQYEQGGSPQRFQWILALRTDANNVIRPRVTINGASSTVSAICTNLSVSLNTDYYLAMVYNTNGTATIYLQYATASLQTEVLTNLPTGILQYSNTNAPFRIGAFRSAATTTNYFSGLIDEVRVSTSALSVSNLLVSSTNSSGVSPSVLTAPRDTVVGLGDSATFNVVAGGSSPLYYKWYSNGVPAVLLQGGTNLSSLVLTNVQLAQSGSAYYVVVTNSYGSVTSTPPATLTVVDTSGPTVGYWRFENGVDLGLDSSSKNIALTNGTPLDSVSSYTLPDTNSGGNGAYFSKSIPLTGQNNQAALGLDGFSYLSHVAWPSFNLSTQMTIEAYFNLSPSYTPGVMNAIASCWLDPGNESWAFGIKEATAGGGNPQLRFAFSNNGGSGWGTNASQWTLIPGRDYYAAVVVSNTIVTFYLVDLSSTNLYLQSQTYVASQSGFYKTSAPFCIGSILNVASFNGYADEVRLSRVALSPTQLLYNIATPAPGISQQPQSISVDQGGSATFTVTATGQAPLSYQWYNASGPNPITSATNTSLSISNIDISQTGSSYYVVVTNSFGSVTSSPAVITVIPSTLTYWRFENAGNLGLDSGSGGVQLTDQGLPVAYALPVWGSGSAGATFPKTIPTTGQTNTSALQLDGLSSYLASGSGPFSSARSDQMTIEAYFNANTASTNSTSTPLVGRWGVAPNLNWLLAIRGPETNITLRFAFNNGITTAIIDATNWNFNPTTNKDYYAAVVFNAGNVTLYLAQLGTYPVIQHQIYTSSLTNIANSSVPISIGEYGSGTLFTGIIDEVRYSRVALPPEQLLLVAETNYPPSSISSIAFNKNGPSNSVELSAIGIQGATYSVLRTTNLALPHSAWQILASNIVGTINGAISFVDTNPPVSNAFYQFSQP